MAYTRFHSHAERQIQGFLECLCPWQMISWKRQLFPKSHQTELRTTQGETAQKRDFDLCFLLCFGEKLWDWDNVAHSGYPWVPYILGFIMENIYYLLFLIGEMPNPSCQGAPSFPMTQPTPLLRIFPYIDGYSPHGPSERHPGNTDCHENPGKLKFQKLLFTQVEWKLFSYVVTCSNCSQIVWNKQINSFSPGKAVYSHCQHWSADWN